MATEATIGITTAQVDSLRYHRALDPRALNPEESDAILCSMVPYGSRVLDVGCGTGILMDLLKHLRRADCVGIEPDPERANAARVAGHTVVSGYLAPDVLAELGSFDVVLFADVLEHLVDPSAMLTMIRPALKPGALVLASIPNVAHWTVRLSLLLGRFNYEASGIMDATHLRWFTAKGVITLFQASGYRLESMRHSGGTWMKQYEGWMFRLLPARLRRLTIIKLKNLAPHLFGCQHVVCATLQS